MNKTFLIIFIGRVFQVFIAFVTLKVVTNYLSPTNVAYYFLILSIINYFGLALISPAGQYVNRQLHLWKEQGVVLNRFLNHGIYIAGVSFLAIPIILLCSKIGLVQGLSSFPLALTICLAVFFNTTTTTLVPAFNMLKYRVSFVVMTILWLFFSLFFSILFVLYIKENILYWFAGQILSQIIFSILAFCYLKKYLGESLKVAEAQSSITRQSLIEILRFSFPLLISSLLLWGITDSFRFILERTHGLEYVALFSVGFAIAQRLSYAVESIVHQVYLPDYYASITSSQREIRSEALRRLLRSSLPFYFGTMFLTIACSPWLIQLFSGKQYLKAVPFVVAGGFFHFFRKLTAIFSLVAQSEKKTHTLILPYFVGALFSTVGIFFFSFGDFYLPGIIIALGGGVMFFLTFFNMNNLINKG